METPKLNFQISFVLCILVTSSAGLWSCQSDSECRTLEGSYCSTDGTCECPYGQVSSALGLRCLSGATDYLSPCENNFQCDYLVTGYRCARHEVYGQTCHCSPGYHYTRGRCWPTIGYDDGWCARSEECLATQLTDLHSLTCNNGTCLCADGYYLRQAQECRKIGSAPGDGCTLDADCQFDDGACDYQKLICYDTAVGVPDVPEPVEASMVLDISLLGSFCESNSDCSEGLECSRQNHCICPTGYRLEDDRCYADLGSPSTKELCNGFLAEVREGECRCPVNFYYDMDMRNCIKATLRFTDSCVSDANCYTFGRASFCGEPTEPWGFRYCECDATVSVKDEEQQMCRLYSALGGTCAQATDCYAGNVEILCLPDSEGINRCTCPDDLEAVDGLCLRRGLVLGEQCQVSDECNGLPNLFCDETTSLCVCSSGYFESNGNCLAAVGGKCITNADCTLDGLYCSENSTCACSDRYTEYEERCIEISDGYSSNCTFDVQCSEVMGDGSYCNEGTCDCYQTHNPSGGRCFERKELNTECRTSGECYVSMFTERVVCRNSICQCDFEYPYNEELGICGTISSAGRIYISTALISIVLMKAFF